MSDPAELSHDSEEGRERRKTMLRGCVLALVGGAVLVGLWLARPMAGARTWEGRTLCGKLGAGSTGDGVEESGLGSAGGEEVRLRIAEVDLLGRFRGTLSGGRFGAAQPVSGWLRARGFSASYDAGPTVRGGLRGAFRREVLGGTLREVMMPLEGDDGRLIVTTAAFHLEPCPAP